MLKCITFKNILSFKNEVTFDLELYKKAKDDILSRTFVKQNVNTVIEISKFALVYGKNNSGKSNLLRIIHDTFRFIRNNQAHNSSPFERFGTQSELPIEIELELINENTLYRYGFILNKLDEIHSEWLYANINLSKTETMIFERFYDKADTLIINKTNFLKKFDVLMSKLNSDKLILSLLFNFEIPEIRGLVRAVANETSIFDIEKSVENNIPINQLDRFCNEPENLKTLNNMIRLFDTNIKELKIERVDQELTHQIEEVTRYIQELKQQDKKQKEISESIRERFGEETLTNLLTSLPSSYIIGQSSNDEVDNLAYSFKATFNDSSKNVEYDIKFSDLSFGTRKLIVFLLNVLTAENGSVFLVDEIEHGFHKLLLNAFLNTLFKISHDRDIQFIFTTHEEDLLDYEKISPETKVVLNNENDSSITYISDYKTRTELKKSKRYISGAYLGVPNLKS